MSDHGATLTDLPLDGERVEVSKFSKVIKVAGLIGAVTLAASLGILFLGGGELRQSFSYSWLFACYYFFTIAVGGLFWVLLHHVSNCREKSHGAFVQYVTIFFYLLYSDSGNTGTP